MFRILKDFMWIGIIVAALCIGILVFEDRKYLYVSILIAIVSCVMAYSAYERKSGNIRRMVVISVMVSAAVAGRCIFAAVPGFKPVTAMVIITAVYLGSEAGFVTGSLTALVSDMFFGIGPWTPFQMAAFGMAGLIAGIPFMQKLLRYRPWLLLYGAAAGAAYSAVMDVWTVISIEGMFNAKRYMAAFITSMPFILIYSLSNVIFLTVLIKPIGKKLERMNKRHCIF